MCEFKSVPVTNAQILSCELQELFKDFALALALALSVKDIC
jgi:hypothetical protein